MRTVENITARIEFLTSTRDENDQIKHFRGEVITGSLLARKQDFLLVRTASGTCMYVDTSRTDLYAVKMEQTVA